jgi:hypothetical protein
MMVQTNNTLLFVNVKNGLIRHILTEILQGFHSHLIVTNLFNVKINWSN